jgi:hypothetical protein
MLSEDTCPTCALAKSSLAALAPNVAAEWHATKNAIRPDELAADHVMNAWWTCPNGHEYQATVRSRTQGNRRCPTCYGGWSLESIRAFVKSLVRAPHKLDPSELFALAMQAGVLKDKGKPFVMALTNGRFPVEELEKFANGQPSIVDDFRRHRRRWWGRPVDAVDLVDHVPPGRLSAPAADRSVRAAGEAPRLLAKARRHRRDADVDVSKCERRHRHRSKPSKNGRRRCNGKRSLPIDRDARRARRARQRAHRQRRRRDGAFLLDSAKAKLWRHAYVDPDAHKRRPPGSRATPTQASCAIGSSPSSTTPRRWSCPQGYAFRPGPRRADRIEPNLMQRRVAVCVRDAAPLRQLVRHGRRQDAERDPRDARRRRRAHGHLLPQRGGRQLGDVEITKAFPIAKCRPRPGQPVWKDPMGTMQPRYLVMNFEQFQQPELRGEARRVRRSRTSIDFVVIDEIHYAKQRDAGDADEQAQAARAGPGARGRQEEQRSVRARHVGHAGDQHAPGGQEPGRDDHRSPPRRSRRVVPTVQNCMRLYQRLVTLGTRWKPEYKIQLDVQKIEVDCAPELERIRAIGRGTVLELEQVLTELRLPTILENIKPGEKVLIYTHYVDGIVATLRDALVKRRPARRAC